MTVTPLKKRALARAFACTDTGNGERFATAYGDVVRWVERWRAWMVWDGQRWVKGNEEMEVQRLAKEVVRTIYREAERFDRKEQREMVAKWALASEMKPRLNAMLECAKTERPVPMRTDTWDASPWLLNVMNGTLDLQTGTLRPHSKDDYLTKLTPIVYTPDAICPTWERFLLRIFEEDLHLCDYVQRAVGYSLTGTTGEQVLHLMHGTGSNGKSTFLEVLAALLGDYSLQADFTVFLDDKGRGPRDDIARLAGTRMVRSSELGEGKRFNESLVKSVTGGDTIACRFLYSDTFEFRPQFKLWLAANHKPVIRGTDHAIWRRVRLLPFTVTIGEEEKDPLLLDKLRAELPGILAWAVNGCQLWLENGLGAPDQVLAATAAYREESDVIGSFLDECCDISNGQNHPQKARSSDLYSAYQKWAKDNGEYELSQTLFGKRLQERGFVVEKSGGVKYRKGLTLHYVPANKPPERSMFGNQDT